MSLRNLFSPENRPLTLLVLVAAALALYGYLKPEPAIEGRYFYLENAGGAVLFTHAAHQENDTMCVTCHHALIQGDAENCNECHDDGDYTVDDFTHAELLDIEDHSCDGCHTPLPDADARGCRVCHPAASTGSEKPNEPLNCQQCHDDPDYIADDFTHTELLDLEDHSCIGCHQPGPIGEIYHQDCTACHRGREPERFIDDQDQAICKSCHLI